MEKVARMHKLFGYGQGLCCDCCNLISVAGNSKHYKCMIYGVSHSTATDWAQRWIACGMKDKKKGDIEPVYREKPKKAADDQIEGQMDIFDFIKG